MALGPRKLAKAVNCKTWNFSGVMFSTIRIKLAYGEQAKDEAESIVTAFGSPSLADTEAQLYFYTCIFIINFSFSLS